MHASFGELDVFSYACTALDVFLKKTKCVKRYPDLNLNVTLTFDQHLARYILVIVLVRRSSTRTRIAYYWQVKVNAGGC